MRPSGLTGMWPTSPANPPAPVSCWPSTIRPPPTPTSPEMKSTCWASMAAPRRSSASAPRSASLATAIGSAVPSASARRSPSGTSRQPRFGAIVTMPASRRTMPTIATPMPIRPSVSGSRRSTARARAARSAMVSSTEERSRGRSRRTTSMTSPPIPTAATASESTAISSARTMAPRGLGRTSGDGRPGVPCRVPGCSETRPVSASSPMSPRIALRVNPVLATSSDRETGPRLCSSRRIELRLDRLTVSLRCPGSS